MKIRIKTLLVCIAVPVLGGALSALLTSGGIAGFRLAEQPPFAPPAWLFPVVWTLLYTLMGIASYLVVTSADNKSSAAIKFYGAQLLFNLLWPFWFFELGAYWFSFAWLVALFVLAAITAAKFWRISRPAGLMFVPYLVWLAIAAYLNIGVAILN